jgi:hypothetical protein
MLIALAEGRPPERARGGKKSRSKQLQRVELNANLLHRRTGADILSSLLYLRNLSTQICRPS